MLRVVSKILFAAWLLVVCCVAASAQGSVRVCNSAQPQNCLAVNSDGSINTAAVYTPGSGTYVSTAALAANLVVKNATAKLVSFEVAADSTLSAAAWWIMVYDATSAPVDGAVTPAKCYGVPSGTVTAAFAFPNPITFSTGIVVGVSTSGCFTKTASTHAFISGDWE